MDSKKISFGFSKLSKKLNVLPTKPLQRKNDVELIDCIEEQSIKVINGKEEKSKGPLVIPINEPANQIIDRIKESRAKRIVVKNEVDERPDSELTLDELAARELLREAKNAEAEKTTTKVLEVPNIDDAGVVEEKVEPDYESVPISDFGMAMLRGMGWKEGMAIGKNPNAKIEVKEHVLRPKGLGLGANKMANVGQQPVKNSGEEELLFKKGAYAKITAGHHKSSYCQVEGFDDEQGRVFVKLAVGGTILSVNECLLALVTKQEYEKSSKVINNAKYEEYIKSETNRSRDEPDVSGRIKKEVKEERSSRSKSVERSHRKHKKSSKKHKKRRDSSSTDDDGNDDDGEEKERKSRRSRKDRSRSRSRERSRKEKRSRSREHNSSRKHKSKHKR